MLRTKLLALGGIALAGGVALMAGSQPWVSIMLDGKHEVIPVPGHEINPALSPIAIALVAAALALTIAGPVFRRVLGGLVALLAGGVVALSISVVTNPLGAVTGKITELTGIMGAQTTATVVWHQLSAGVWVTLVAGIVAALLGILVLVFGGRWVAGGRKYATTSEAQRAGQVDRISDWDALSDGDDPTEDIR